MSSPFLIAGLGNPGTKYLTTWHNCGFMAIDYISQKYSINVKKLQFKGLTGRGKIAGEDVILLLPQTYMNLSGESILEALRYYKIPPEHFIVIYDDLDQKVGGVRMRANGGAGTHNGMRSIVSCLNTQNFPRIRIGIGPKPDGWDLADYVLSNIGKDKQQFVFNSLELCCEGVELFLSRGVEAAMNEINRKGKVE